MNRRILIFTVLISNIAFGSVLPIEFREFKEISTNKNGLSSLADAAVIHLYEKGLDKNAAEQKVTQVLKGHTYTDSLMAQNIIEKLNEIKHEDVVAYISNAALYGTNVDLSSYSTLVNLAHKGQKIDLDRSTLDKIKKISQENKQIKSFVREA